jgi:hypothetical protein
MLMKRTFAKQSVHDHIVRLVARQWAKPLSYYITINPGAEKNIAAGRGQYPDLVGWKVAAGKKILQWVAEVETEESVTEAEARTQWRSYAGLGVPFYLIVPKGYRTPAQVCARRALLSLPHITEYGFEIKTFRLM